MQNGMWQKNNVTRAFGSVSAMLSSFMKGGWKENYGKQC